MMNLEIVQTTFVVQFVLVTAFLLMAATRTRRLRAADEPAPAGSGEGGHRHGRTRAIPTVPPMMTRGATSTATGDGDAEGAADMEQKRARLARDLELLRETHAREEESFRTRRRAALLEMQEYRRISADLCAEEPQLRRRVCGLRADVEHLEHRRAALAAEVAASVEKSSALRDRILLVQRDLATLRLDRERVSRRVRSDGQRLRDLSRRREVLRAETEELSALLDLLQQLTGQPTTLTSLSDGELRTGTGTGTVARADVMASADTPAAEQATSTMRDRSRI